TLALDRHPIRAHPPPLAARLHFARQLDRPAKQQQFLGQGGLAGVRMRNDRKRPPAQNLVAKITHQSVSIIPGAASSAERTPAPTRAVDMMAAGLFANAFPGEPGSPPVFAGKIQQGGSRRSGNAGTPLWHAPYR